MGGDAFCTDCGRRRDRPDQRYCGDCGAALLAPEGGERGFARDGASDRDRLGAVYRHPDWSLLREHAPSPSGPAAGMGCLAVLGLAMSLGASAIAVVVWRRHAPLAPWQWAAVGGAALVSVTALAWGLRSLARLAAFLGADLRRMPVVVLERRRHTSGDGRGGEGRAQHFVTVEDEDGLRRELACTPRVAAAVAEDDVAVAYVKGGVLLDLVRLD